MSEPLPRPRTRFVGRRRALERIPRLLSEGRLLTLTGVGGSGKTRLALRVAEEAVPGLADEIGWVELAPLDDPRLVTAAVCSSLRVRLAAGMPPLDALAERLRSSRTLLGLDNCEHVVEGCADLVADLLERCPDLRVLATSRQSLGVPGEVTWEVGSLSLPDDAGTDDAGRDDAGADDSAPDDVGIDDTAVRRAARAESVRLFVDRVRAGRPDFELTPGNVGAVVRVCRRLEGIPLALELAAGRVRVLAVEQIAERLDEGLDLLRGSGPGAPERHRTMRAALEWSHDLLPEPEKVLFRRLGAFGGQPSIEACESVCAGGSLERPAILALLARLVDKSLVAVDDRGGSAAYRLLEPVRHFARERLEESGELDRIRRRHTAYYLDLARDAAPGLRGPGRAASLERLESAHDDLRRAWDYAVEAGDGASAGGLARALFWFWQFGGHFGEGRSRSEEALRRLAHAGRDADARAALLYAAGALAWMQGDGEVARTRLEACVADCRERGREDLLSEALRELAGVRLTVGDLTAAAELYEESASRLRAAKRDWDLALALVMLADVRQGLGETAAARELREEARVLFARTGDPWGRSVAHFGLAVDAARTGDLEDARLHAREALALQSDGGDDWNLGQVLALLGEIDARHAHADAAAELLVESLEAFRDVGDRASIAYVLRTLAEVERVRGRTLRAVRLAGAADAREETLEGRYPYALATEEERAETVAALRRAAGAEAFAEEWAAGRAMRLDEAVEFALETSGIRRVEGSGDGPTAALRVSALGPPKVRRGRRRLRAADWTYALPRELLFYLLVQGPRTKEQIGLDFWPEASPDQLRGRFRTTVYHLRRALGGTEWVRYENGRYGFDRSLDYWFDVEAFETSLDLAAEQTDSDARAAASHLERAIELYRGDFLEGETPGPWAEEHADRLRRRYLDALRTLAGLRASEGLHDLAAELYRRAVDRDDLDERAHRGLARSLASAGDRTAALRQLERLERLLRRELDADPSPETLELRARLERPS